MKKVAKKTKAPKEEKPKTELDKFKAELRKVHGPNIITKANVYPRHNHISTGVFILDMALGGGYAQGHPGTIFGWENQGKTTLAMRAVAEFQVKEKITGRGRKAAWVAMEEFDPLWAKVQGVDIDDLELVRPDSGEQAVDIINGLSRVEEIGFIVLDSIANLISMKMAEASAEDIVMAHVAKLAGPMCSKLSQSFLVERKRGHFVTILNINQYRFKMTMFGDPRIVPGGTQTNFFHSTKVEISNKEKLGKDGRGYEIVERNVHSFVIKKAKVNSMRSGEFEMVVQDDQKVGKGGIDDAGTLGSFAQDFGLFEGGPKKLYFAPFDWHIDGREDLETQIRDVTEFRQWLGQLCIAQSRLMNNGLPPFPKDGYLYGAARLVDKDFDFEAQREKATLTMQEKAKKHLERAEKKAAKDAAKRGGKKAA